MISTADMTELKRRAAEDLVDGLSRAYRDGSLSQAISETGIDSKGITQFLNRVAIESMIGFVVGATGTHIHDHEKGPRQDIQLEDAAGMSKWARDAINTRARELLTEDFDEAIRVEGE